MIDYENEASAGPDANQLKLISELAARQVQLEAELAELEAKVKEKAKALRQVQEKDLPDAMTAAGCKAYTTVDGRSITIKEDISASLAEGKKGPAIEWLRANGYGDIVSEDVTVAFGKGQEEQAHALVEELTQKGLIAVRKANVNTATLKALIRELLAEGVDVPLETLGAYEWKKAIIK